MGRVKEFAVFFLALHPSSRHETLAEGLEEGWFIETHFELRNTS